METIENKAGEIGIELTIPLPALCPHTSEPQSGSTLTWRYEAGALLLELKAARKWPMTQTSEPLDLETLTQRAADAARASLGVPVQTIGHYILKDGTVLRCQAQS